MLKIITHPNSILQKKSQPVADILNPKIQKLIKRMVPTMIKADGIGLAAPQIGKNIRLTVINHQDRVLVLINPKIVKKSWLKEWGEEGCLSVPNIFGEVKRHKRITLIYTDKNNQKQKLQAKGLLARVIQHEIDHLDGILFIDKARNIKKMF